MSDESLFTLPHVLVVEDDPMLQQALIGLLHAEGYATSGVASLEEALAAVDETAFDLIVADLIAGKSRHSFTPAHILRRHTPSTPMGIFTPERVSPWDERWSVFAFILPKPIALSRLFTEVAACLDRPLSAAQTRQAEVVRRFVEALVARQLSRVFNLCTRDVLYAPSTALLHAPAPRLEGYQAITVYTSSIWQQVPDLRLEVIAIYSRPRGLALRYMRVAPSSDEGWAWQEQTEVFAFVGDLISQIGLPDLQQPLPQEDLMPQVG